MPRSHWIPTIEKAVEEARQFAAMQMRTFGVSDPSYAYFSEELRSLAYGDRELSTLDGRVYSLGNSASSIGLMNVISALVSRSVEDGAEAALKRLDDFLATDINRVIDVLILKGIEVDDTVEVAPGILLSPLHKVPSSHLRQFMEIETAFKKPELRPFSLMHFFDEQDNSPQAALYRHREVSPKFLTPPKKGKTFKSQMSPPSTDIYEIAKILTVTGPSSPVIYKSYSELADGEFMKGHSGYSAGHHDSETRVRFTKKITVDEITAHQDVYLAYLRMPDKAKKILDVSLHRLNEAIKHLEPVDRALDLGIALESLFLSGEKSRADIGLKVRRRGAWLLGETAEAHEEILTELKTIYDLRSCAAHSGSFASARRTTPEVERVLLSGISLCSAAILKIVRLGQIPQWKTYDIGDEYAGDRSTDSAK